MNADKLKQQFKQQFKEATDNYEKTGESNVKCAMAAGMLLILSALRRFDGPSLSIQIALMHSALREFGEEQGWAVDKNGD